MGIMPSTGTNEADRDPRRYEAEAKLMAAAEEIFALRGFKGATTSAIALRAGLPKANLHYYFRTKELLYSQVLENILQLWLATADLIQPQADPAEALKAYIAEKIRLSRERPFASKVFANEILHGAPYIRDYLRRELRGWVQDKTRVFESWVNDGKIIPVDVPHLFFAIWSATQTYADFNVQIAAVLNRNNGLAEEDFNRAQHLIERMVLALCGLRG